MQHHIPVDTHTSELKFERNEEKQMYEYLLMRFYELNFLDDSKLSNNYQQFQQLATSIYSCLYSSSVLDLCMQSSIKTALSHQPYKFDDLKDQKHKAKRVILVQALTQDYQSVFLRPQNNDSSVQKIIFATITNQSLISIANCILQYPDLIKDDILNLMNPDLNFVFSAIIVYHKINLRNTSSSDSSQQLQDNMKNVLIEMDLSQDLKRKVFFVLNQYLCQIFSGKKDDYQRFNQQFQSQFQTFKSKYKPSQTRINQHILLLHYFHQTLLNTKNPELFNQTHAQSQQFFGDKEPNSLINIFNKFQQQNTIITDTNKQLLKSFIVEPYQTSLFVLFQLLSNCGLRTINNIFTRNPVDFRDFTLVSPMAFLLIDPKKINRSNAQSFSLSLWIILDVWIRNSCDQRSPFKQQIHQEQTPNNSQVTESSTKDPRHVYRIKRDAYPNYDSHTIPFRNPHANGNKKPQNGTSSTDDYLIRLNQTMMIYLLSLQVETTILKYYPIQNQIFWRLIQIEVVPSLLIHSPFALKTITNQIQKPKNSNVNPQFNTDKELLQRIEAADDLEEIELLQKLFHDQMSSHPQNPQINANNQTQNSVFESEYNQWVLPWMSLVSASSLSHIINFPQGPNLVVKLIEKQPNNFMKLYSLESISQIIYFLKNEKIRLEGPSKATQKVYKLKGNKNVKMKKTIDYESKPSTNDPIQGKNKVSCLKGLSEQACKEQLEAVRKILQMHRGKRIDENIIKGALQLFDQLDTKIYPK